MPRYHFSVEDGSSYPDKEGTVLPDLEAARIEAVRRSGALLLENPETFWNGDSWKLTVTDEKRMIMFTLHFLATSAPVTQQYAVRPSQLED